MNLNVPWAPPAYCKKRKRIAGAIPSLSVTLIYREFPASSKEADLKKNLLSSLEMVSLVSMRKYACRAQQFMHAYHREKLKIKDHDAAWACKKYRRHQVIPSFLLASLDKIHST
jgi:hypothetical protein